MAKTPKKKSTPGQKTIALNKQARHDYYIEQTYEAGMVLQGWEIKSLREGRVQLKESYVIMEKGEAVPVWRTHQRLAVCFHPYHPGVHPYP